MDTSKIFVSAGCSFSECFSAEYPNKKTWPYFVSESLQYQSVHTAIGGNGNGLIARNLIYTLTKLLENQDSTKILVGVAWSSSDRFEFYHNDAAFANNEVLQPQPNPVGFVADSDKKWYRINANSDNSYGKIFHQYFHDDCALLINTIEHILRIQWFLKLHNVSYFMTAATDQSIDRAQINHPEIDYLYKQIDFSRWLPVSSVQNWCRNHSGLPWPKNTGGHPSEQQQQKFAEHVIIPFIQHGP